MLTATLGNAVRIGTTAAPILVKDSTGALVDPASITITVRRPDGTLFTETPTRVSLGSFTAVYEPDAVATSAGTHRYRIQSVSPDAAYEDTIYFSPSVFLP